MYVQIKESNVREHSELPRSDAHCLIRYELGTCYLNSEGYRVPKLQFAGIVYTHRVLARLETGPERSSFQICAKLVGDKAADHARL